MSSESIKKSFKMIYSLALTILTFIILRAIGWKGIIGMIIGMFLMAYLLFYQKENIMLFISFIDGQFYHKEIAKQDSEALK